MWKKMFPNSWGRSKTLSEILKGEGNQAMLLGAQRIVVDREKESERDAVRVLAYSKSADYAVWAGEVWRSACSCISILTKNNLPDNEAAFYRGMLAQALDDLKISYEAREGIEKRKQNTI